MNYAGHSWIRTCNAVWLDLFDHQVYLGCNGLAALSTALTDQSNQTWKCYMGEVEKHILDLTNSEFTARLLLQVICKSLR